MSMSSHRFPDYWHAARAKLAERDPVLASIMASHPDGGLSSHGDAFVTLARAIVGQQISVTAADAVWARLVTALGEVCPQRALALSAESLRGCGLSYRKAEYLHDLATHFADGRLHPELFAEADDAELMARLTAVRGIGRWSAEMFLIFHLMRPDVFPVDDIGLLRAISLHYADGAPVDARRARAVGERWAPYRTVATWYLWRALDPVPVAY